mgnify:CR=1 FL=1
MKKFFIFIFLVFSFFILSNCSSAAIATVGESTKKRARMCKNHCKEDHHNIILIRANGKVERHKINIISFNRKIVCECIF